MYFSKMLSAEYMYATSRGVDSCVSPKEEKEVMDLVLVLVLSFMNSYERW